jgi:hypothetical protein
MPTYVNPLWPTMFAVAGALMLLRKAAAGIQKTSDLSSASRLFLLIAASLFTLAGFTDVIARMVVIGIR